MTPRITPAQLRAAIRSARMDVARDVPGASARLERLRALADACPDCEAGVIEHEGEPGDVWRSTCQTCSGTGRLSHTDPYLSTPTEIDGRRPSITVPEAGSATEAAYAAASVNVSDIVTDEHRRRAARADLAAAIASSWDGYVPGLRASVQAASKPLPPPVTVSRTDTLPVAPKRAGWWASCLGASGVMLVAYVAPGVVLVAWWTW